MSAAVSRLRQLVDRVERSVERERARLQQQIDRQGSVDLEPEDMLDMHGRPILLDAQIALLNAACVLAQYDQTPVRGRG